LRAQLTEPPDADPHVLVVWQGRAGDRSPYADFKLKFLRAADQLQAVTFNPLPVACVEDELDPLAEPELLPAVNCARSCSSAANSVCALERFPVCNAVESEFSVCETWLPCCPPPPP
jgi:hypothetical protein